MTRRTALRVVGTFVACLGLLAQPVRLPAGQGSTHWIIIGGGNPGSEQAVGVILAASPDNDRVIPADRNSHIQASGSIVTGLECAPGDHYHGALFGASDDSLNCGWGAVIQIGEAPASVLRTSNALNYELHALVFLQQEPPNLRSAIDAITRAQKQLKLAKQQALADRRRRRLSDAESKQIQGKLKNAGKRDARALKLIKKLQGNQGGPGDLLAAISLLNGAISDKRDAFSVLVSGLGLLKEA